MGPPPDPLFERLQRALSPDYRLERELGSGGMGRVFLATDLTLNRPVAVKVLRPELVTAQSAADFTREAQILSRIRHPNIVTIYHASPPGGKEGLHYYVMEFIEGPTLEERLETGPLATSDAVKLGRDLLDALETVHRAGMVHRDVKPSNIFLLDDPRRALLADFGIAIAPFREPRPRHQRSADSGKGTPGFMAPEQIAGDPVTPRTDLYLAGMVIYEALTRRRYPVLDGNASWTDVRRSVARVLRRALRAAADERWPDARTFRHELWRTRVYGYLVRAAILAVGGIIVGATAVVVGAFIPARESPGTLAVSLPRFDYVGPPAQRPIADSLVDMLRTELRAHPDFRVSTSRWGFVGWPFRSPALVIRGRVAVTRDDVNVQLTDVRLRGPGTALAPAEAPAAAWATLRDSLTYRVLLAVWDSLSPLAHSLPRAALPRTPLGLARFLNAEQLVARGEWGNAYLAYLDAETTDPTCWLCSWRLNEVERWLGRPHDQARVQRFLNHVDSFPKWYATLIRAGQLPVSERLESLRVETATWQDFFLGYLQLGDETFHRGPLVGHPRAEAIPAFEMAARYRPDFAPAWEHLAWVDIAEGDSAGAARALTALDRRNVGDDPFAIRLRALLGVAFAFRFLPERVAVDSLQRALSDSAVQGSGDVAAGPRMLGAFDAPAGEVAFGEILAASPVRVLKRSGLIAQTLGSVALGKPTRALELAQQLANASSEAAIVRFRADLEQTLARLERADVDSTSPFYRTVTRLRLAEEAAWHGDSAGARRQLIWHEHTDINGLPTEMPQTAEVDWAFGTLARWRLANLLARTGERAEACKAYRDVARLWGDGEPLYRARADTARHRVAELCA